MSPMVCNTPPMASRSIHAPPKMVIRNQTSVQKSFGPGTIAPAGYTVTVDKHRSQPSLKLAIDQDVVPSERCETDQPCYERQKDVA